MENQTNQNIQLNNPALLEKVKAKTEEYFNFLMAPESKKLAHQIEITLKKDPELATKNPELFNQYQSSILKLKLIAISLYEDATILELIKKHYLDSLKMGLDLNERLAIKMYSVPDMAWPDFAQDCLRAIKENQQAIGNRKIIIKNEEESKPPYIKNWLTDYDRIFSIDKHTELERAQYLSQSQGVKGLSDQEKKWLHELLKFYDNLKPWSRSVLEKAIHSVSGKTESDKTILPGTPSRPFSRPTDPRASGNIVDLKNKL